MSLHKEARQDMTIKEAQEAKKILDEMFDKEVVRITTERFLGLFNAYTALEFFIAEMEKKGHGTNHN